MTKRRMITYAFLAVFALGTASVADAGFILRTPKATIIPDPAFDIFIDVYAGPSTTISKLDFVTIYDFPGLPIPFVSAELLDIPLGAFWTNNLWGFSTQFLGFNPGGVPPADPPGDAPLIPNITMAWLGDFNIVNSSSTTDLYLGLLRFTIDIPDGQNPIPPVINYGSQTDGEITFGSVVVPEPGTFVLLGLGGAGLGLTALRRRMKAAS